MPRHGCCELVVCLDECKEGVVVRGGVVGMYIALYRTRRRLTAFGELFNQLVAEDLVRRRRLHDLEEEFAGCFCFFDALGQFVRGG